MEDALNYVVFNALGAAVYCPQLEMCLERKGKKRERERN